jgi:alpha-mannosidase
MLKRNDDTDADQFVTLQFLAALPALGHANFSLISATATDPAPQASSTVVVRGDTLSNDRCSVRLHADGTLDVEVKATGRTYSGLNRLEDTEDVGDEYDYSPCERSDTVTSEGAEGTIRVVREGLSGSLEVDYELMLPARIGYDRKHRVAERVGCRVRTRITLTLDSPVVEVQTTFDNRACDHRLRARFPTGIATDHLISDGHFAVERRPIRQPDGSGWVQPPSGSYPQQEFSLVGDGNAGLAVLNRGLPEIEATQVDGTVTLSLTLLRCVEWLSRDDLPTRNRTNAGPTLHTPEAQCIGTHRFRYAVLPFAGDDRDANIHAWSRRYRTPPIAIQGVADGALPGGRGLMHKTTDRSVVSTIKKHEERDTLVVRLYNPTALPIDETLIFGPQIVSAWRVDLLEERSRSIATEDGHGLVVHCGAHEIVTVEIELAR